MGGVHPARKAEIDERPRAGHDPVPAAAGADAPAGRDAVGRRAADARHRAGDDGPAARPAPRRAVARPRADPRPADLRDHPGDQRAGGRRSCSSSRTRSRRSTIAHRGYVLQTGDGRPVRAGVASSSTNDTVRKAYLGEDLTRDDPDPAPPWTEAAGDEPAARAGRWTGTERADAAAASWSWSSRPPCWPWSSPGATAAAPAAGAAPRPAQGGGAARSRPPSGRPRSRRRSTRPRPSASTPSGWRLTSLEVFERRTIRVWQTIEPGRGRRARPTRRCRWGWWSRPRSSRSAGAPRRPRTCARRPPSRPGSGTSRRPGRRSQLDLRPRLGRATSGRTIRRRTSARAPPTGRRDATSSRSRSAAPGRSWWFAVTVRRFVPDAPADPDGRAGLAGTMSRVWTSA